MNIISKEVQIIQNQASQLLSQKHNIMNELDIRNVAKSIIGTEHLICTISIMKKPKDKQQEIRLFEELDKLQGVTKE